MSENFYKQLKIGNEKELFVCNILNLCGIKTESNNQENVKDIDLKMDPLKIIMDVKFINTVFNNAKTFVGLKPENCLPINVSHVNNYFKKELTESSQAWVCFLIHFDCYNINELKFIPVSYLKHLIDSGTGSVRNGKLNIDRTVCYDMTEFLKFCEKRNKIINNPNTYSFK